MGEWKLSVSRNTACSSSEDQKNINIAEMPTATQGRADVSMRFEAICEGMAGKRGMHEMFRRH